MSIKINTLELENVKRIKAVKLEPTENGLTVIGGKNNNGKTSILDAIAWALGGNKFKPSKATREGSMVPASLKVTLSNGLIVERKGKASTLKVTDPTGKKGSQKLLDEFIEELAINLPKFMNADEKKKTDILLRVIGVGDELAKIEEEYKELYSERRAVGRLGDEKAKFAKAMKSFPDAPSEPVSASELIRQQQEILARNGENAKKRERVVEFEHNMKRISDKINELTEKLASLQNEYDANLSDLEIARTEAKDLVDESTAELEMNIKNIEQINEKVRKNAEKQKAIEEAGNFNNRYREMTEKLQALKNDKISLLNNAKLPLEGLSVDDGKITYKGQEWDNMSGSQQLKVATSIVRKLNPKCGFVLLDKLEQMDIDTLKEFGKWLEDEGLQAIATRVSTGDECSVIIEDGYVKSDAESESVTGQSEKNKEEEPKGEEPKWEW